MSSTITVKESNTGVLDTPDILVKIFKKESLAPQSLKYAKINVLASKKNGNGDLKGELVTEATKDTYSSKIDEADELNFKGTISLWNVASITDKEINKMRQYGETLVILSGQSKTLAAKIESTESNGKPDFKDLIVWFTDTAGNGSNGANTTTSGMATIAKQPRRGVMLDTEKKGKLLFALTSMLESPRTLSFTSQILNSSFKGITDTGTAQSLDDIGYSYFFKTVDRTWLRGFWLAGQQARSTYAQSSVAYDVRYSVAHLVNEGLNISEESLALIEVKILTALKKNPFVLQILDITIPPQTATSMSQGKIEGISVTYQTAQEVRTVSITLSGGG